MSKKNVLIFCMLCIMFAAVFYFLTYDIDSVKKRSLIEISVIVRGKDADNWATIKQGIDQAASDMNVDVSFITLSTENDSQEQANLIEREATNGAAAIIIAAADSEGLIPIVETISERIPIVAIESPVNTSRIESYISANNHEMGLLLAEDILYRGFSSKRIAIMSSANNCDNIIQRQTAISERLKSAACKVEFLSLQNDLSDVSQKTEMLLRTNRADAIVAADLATLEALAQSLSTADPDHRIGLFGMGATGSIASYLEKEIISAVVVQNDFSIGYLGLQTAVNAVELKREDKAMTITCKLITLENMYDDESQKLLFPFVR